MEHDIVRYLSSSALVALQRVLDGRFQSLIDIEEIINEILEPTLSKCPSPNSSGLDMAKDIRRAVLDKVYHSVTHTQCIRQNLIYQKMQESNRTFNEITNCELKEIWSEASKRAKAKRQALHPEGWFYLAAVDQECCS